MEHVEILENDNGNNFLIVDGIKFQFHKDDYESLMKALKAVKSYLNCKLFQSHMHNLSE